MNRPVGIILLAAGGSVRMGRAKQLLPFRGCTLVRHAAETAIGSACRPVVVVLGAGSQEVARELEGLPVHSVANPDWSIGMGTSIAAGVRELLKLQRDVSAAVVMLCDQPFVTAELLDQLVAGHRRDGRERCACAYGGKLGVPALFAASWFPRLLALQREGASRLLNESEGEFLSVPFAEGEMDVDTPGDYERLTEE